MPPETYLPNIPEYYAQIDGKRVGERSFVPSNEEVFEIVLAELRARLEKDPEIAVVSVSRMTVRAPVPARQMQKSGRRGGSPAGNMLDLSTGLPKRWKKEYPHLRIDTLVYQYTRKPPKLTRPRPNVIVRLCSIECCFSHPFSGMWGKRLPPEESR